MTEAASLHFHPQPRRPAWGVRAPIRKLQSTREGIRAVPRPGRVVIALAQGSGPPAVASVTPGQHVRTGEPIAAVDEAPDSSWSTRVHSSITGRVVSIDPQAVAGSLGPVPCIEIAAEGPEEMWNGYADRGDPELLDPAALRERIAAAGIVGLGGALFPAARKLSASGVRILLLNGAECEPYISCDDLLLREHAAEVVAGARILLRTTGAERAVLVIKTDMPEARLALSNAMEAARDPRLALSVVTAKYPAGGERQLIELVTDREVPAGGLPADVGVLCQNVATAAAVADFFREGRPLIRRVITICGGGVREPCNLWAPIGTPIRALIAAAGGYQDGYEDGPPEGGRRLIMGGPMMGIALPNDALPITLATNCLIAATPAELGASAPELPCIRCGDCVEVCPARLMPLDLFHAARHGVVHELDARGVLDCIECGSCDYVCPSHIPLVSHFIRGKAIVRQQREHHARAQDARERHEAQQARRARDERERAAALTRLDPPDNTKA